MGTKAIGAESTHPSFDLLFDFTLVAFILF